MGLIKCPECGKEISDKADVCIGCGFPIKKYVENRENYSESKNEEQTTADDGIIVCKSCGEKNNKCDTYCKSCGTKLTDSDNIMFEFTIFNLLFTVALSVIIIFSVSFYVTIAEDTR